MTGSLRTGWPLCSQLVPSALRVIPPLYSYRHGVTRKLGIKKGCCRLPKMVLSLEPGAAKLQCACVSSQDNMDHGKLAIKGGE